MQALARAFRACAAASLALLAGCAGHPVGPSAERDPLDRPGAPPAVAIVVVPDAPAISRVQTAGSALRGAGAGAQIGGQAAGIAMSTAPMLGPAALIVVLIGYAAGAAVGAAAGALADAATGTPAVSPEALRDTASPIVAERRLPDELADRVVESARRFTPYRVEKADAAGTAIPGDAAFRDFAARGFGAVISLRVTGVGFVGSDAALALFVSAEARLVDPATGRTTWLRGLVHRSADHPQAEWVQDGGLLARRELGKAVQAIGERTVDDLLLHTESIVGIPIGAWVSLPRPRTCGLVPLEPRPALVWQPPSDAVADDAVPVTPRLAWQPLPVAERAYAGVPASRVHDPRYDLRIWNDEGGAPGALVYERIGLGRAEHVVETPLAAGTRYFWSVRLRYDDDGHPRATRWSSQNLQRYGMPPALRALLYHARVENGVAVPLPCGPGDEYACSCLDDVPAADVYAFRTRAR